MKKSRNPTLCEGESGNSRRPSLEAIIDAASANRFLFGLIFCQRQKAEVAWKAPLSLAERLGHFDIEMIADMSEIALASLIALPPRLHPFTSAAEYISKAARLLVLKYDSDARNIWRSPTHLEELRQRLLEFPGIGKHLSLVGIFLLQTEHGVQIADLSEPVDIKSVCPRLHASYFGDEPEALPKRPFPKAFS